MLTGAVDGLRLRLTGNGLAVFVAAFHAALHCFQNVLYVAAIQLEKAGLNHLLRHILAIDTDGRSGRADGIQHDVHDLPEAVFIELRILTENVVVKILFDSMGISDCPASIAEKALMRSFCSFRCCRSSSMASYRFFIFS